MADHSSGFKKKTHSENFSSLAREAASGSIRGLKGTGLLTFRGLLIRDSESFGERFRGAEGT
jgi:hypothetical protein